VSHFSTYAAALQIGAGGLNENGLVNVTNLLELLGDRGPCSACALPGDCPADLVTPAQ
jgi:hypothetical protein